MPNIETILQQVGANSAQALRYDQVGILNSIASGTAYSLTATPAALVFGTTSPTLTGAGTYLLLARVRADYNAATFVAVRTTTYKLRRTNNTAADITNSSPSFLTSIITTLSFTAPEISWWAPYTTTNSDDAITIFGSVSVIPTAGTIDASEASLTAIRLG